MWNSKRNATIARGARRLPDSSPRGTARRLVPGAGSAKSRIWSIPPATQVRPKMPSARPRSLVRSRADPPTSAAQAGVAAIADKIRGGLLDLRQEIIAFHNHLASGTNTFQKDVRDFRFPIYLLQGLFGAGRGEPIRRINDAASHFTLMQELALDAVREFAELRAEEREAAKRAAPRIQQRPLPPSRRPTVAPPIRLREASPRQGTIPAILRNKVVTILALVGLLGACWAVAGLSDLRRFPASIDWSRTGAIVNGPYLAVDLDRKVEALSEAIAVAEGYHATGSYDGHSLPYFLNNPGSLKQSVFSAGNLTSWQDTGLLIFPTSDMGWDALHHQASLMLTGASTVYNLSDDFIEVARKYADGDLQWGVNVANSLGISPRTSLADYAAGPTPTKVGPSSPALTASASQTP